MNPVVVMGHIMLDITAGMTDGFDTAVARQGTTDGKATLTLGGTGIGMARALTPYFTPVHLIGAIGDDLTGDLVAAMLEHEPFATAVETKHGIDTGKVIVVRDQPRADHPQGNRLLIAQRGSNHYYHHNDLAPVSDTIKTSSLLCVDGYGLLHEPRRTATLTAMRLARRGGAHVYLDLVPHDLFRHWTPAEYQHYATHATIVGSSATTLAHLVGIPWPGMEPLDRAGALRVAEAATHSFGDKLYLLHFGIGHCAESIAYHTRPLWYEQTNYPTLPQHQVSGFGDHLAARELHKLLETQEPGASTTRQPCLDTGNLRTAKVCW